MPLVELGFFRRPMLAFAGGTKQTCLGLIVLQHLDGKILVHTGFLSQDFQGCTLSLAHGFDRRHRRRRCGRSALWRY